MLSSASAKCSWISLSRAALRARACAALIVPGVPEQRCQPSNEHVDGHTCNDLGPALGDAGKAMQQGEKQRDGNSRHQGGGPSTRPMASAVVAEAKAAQALAPSPISTTPAFSE